MDGPSQLSERTGLNRIFALFKISYCALGKSGIAREALRGKFFRCRPDFFQIFRSTTLSYSRQVSSISSRTPAWAIIEKSGPPVQRLDASFPM
jgi:hypothetical protein